MHTTCFDFIFITFITFIIFTFTSENNIREILYSFQIFTFYSRIY